MMFVFKHFLGRTHHNTLAVDSRVQNASSKYYILDMLNDGDQKTERPCGQVSVVRITAGLSWITWLRC